MRAAQQKQIQAFLNRDLDSFGWAKALKNRELWREIRTNSAKDVLHSPPFKHQKVCYLIGVNYPQFLFLLDMGTGKSKICLDLIAYHKHHSGATGKKLVVVPNLVNIDNWVEQAKEHQPSLRMVPLLGSTEQRHQTLQAVDGDVYVINYAGLNYLCSTKQRTRSGSMKLQHDLKRVKALFKDFDTVILDEITDCKNHNTLNFKVANALCGICHWRYGLTGTPFGRDPHDLWAQFYLIDRGESLGPTLGVFRSAFFVEKKDYWKGVVNEFDPKRTKDLNRAMRHRSIVYEADECRDMPKKVYQKVHFTLPDESSAYYKRAFQELKQARGNFKKMDNEFIKMRQLCSGFIAARTDDSKVEFELGTNPKLDALDAVLHELPLHAQKAIIFTQYKFSLTLVSQLLERRKIKHVRLDGSTRDKIGTVRKFKSDDKLRVLVANVDSADKGLNLQVAQYCLFYESPTSPIKRRQAEARIRRGEDRGTGKNRRKQGRVFYYDFIAKDTVEVDIQKFLKEGKDLHRSIVRNK